MRHFLYIFVIFLIVSCASQDCPGFSLDTVTLMPYTEDSEIRVVNRAGDSRLLEMDDLWIIHPEAENTTNEACSCNDSYGFRTSGGFDLEYVGFGDYDYVMYGEYRLNVNLWPRIEIDGVDPEDIVVFQAGVLEVDFIKGRGIYRIVDELRREWFASDFVIPADNELRARVERQQDCS